MEAGVLSDARIAYFSMEIGFHDDLPTYAGGLGVLAGDTVRSAADAGVPMVAVSLLYRRGYFDQSFDASGWQREEPVAWNISDHLTELPIRVSVTIEGRLVHLRIWRFDVRGQTNEVVPILLLDSDLAKNSDWDRTLTDHLYGGDDLYRLAQEAILGIGGVRALRALECHRITRFHMNEGHAALLTVELLREQRDGNDRSEFAAADLAAVRQQCVFTTHTPVPAGHDQFPLDLVDRVLGDRTACGIYDPFCRDGRLNMTFLALSLSRYVNGVAKRHAETSRQLFAEYQIDAITNGVHAGRWTSQPFADLFDRRVAGWREDNFSLRYALSLSNDEIWDTHQQAKTSLLDHVNRQTDAGLADDVLTIGFGRRATAYKRVDLIFADFDRLRRMANEHDRIQLVLAGKAHPRDDDGKRMIQRVIHLGKSLAADVRVVYIPNYDIKLARLMTSGVDVWLNTPQPPLEASGTSGMKAALNGVPSLSVLDGWWIEGCIEGVTGWGIREQTAGDERSAADALYSILESTVVPMYYSNRQRFIDIMRHAIALNGSFFNTQRMVQQYVLKAYFE